MAGEIEKYARELVLQRLAAIEARMVDEALGRIEKTMGMYWQEICIRNSWCPYCDRETMECPHCGGAAVHRNDMRITA